MERDFMGLNSKDSVVKEEFVEGGCEDSGFSRSSGVPWQLSLKSDQDEKPSAMKPDIIASHGYMRKPGPDILEARHNRLSGNVQNFGSANVKQQFLGGNLLAATQSILPSGAAVVGTTEQWINSKACNFPAQLTIFYGGTVNVFDDISPEKAQAILFLAGSGCTPFNMAQSKFNMQGPASKVPTANRFMNMPQFSGLPSPLSVSSHPIDHSAVPAANTDDVKVSKTIGMSTTLVNKVEPPKVMSPLGPAAATAMISAAVPQARKASLARFLEKRKERVMNAAPYNLVKKEADCVTQGSNGFSFSATSGIGSSSVSTSKEITG